MLSTDASCPPSENIWLNPSKILILDHRLAKRARSDLFKNQRVCLPLRPPWKIRCYKSIPRNKPRKENSSI